MGLLREEHLLVVIDWALPTASTVLPALSSEFFAHAFGTHQSAVTAGDKIESVRQRASGRCLSADRAGAYSRGRNRQRTYRH